MDAQLSQALATLISAIATAILMAAAYYWGPNQRARRRNGKGDADSNGE